MAGKFNYEKLRKYPHLLGEDKTIWDNFIDSFPERFDTVDYDIHVGSGIQPLDESDIKYSEQWRQLTKKRIDAIGWKNQQPTIIEVKRRVGLDTLGQILGYQFFYLRQFPEFTTVDLLIVCGQIDADEVNLLNHFNIPFVKI